MTCEFAIPMSKRRYLPGHPITWHRSIPAEAFFEYCSFEILAYDSHSHVISESAENIKHESMAMC